MDATPRSGYRVFRALHRRERCQKPDREGGQDELGFNIGGCAQLPFVTRGLLTLSPAKDVIPGLRSLPPLTLGYHLPLRGSLPRLTLSIATYRH